MTEFVIGDRVKFATNPEVARDLYALYYGWRKIPANSVGTVEQAGTRKVRVSFDDLVHYNGKIYTFWLGVDDLELVEGAAGKVRKLGETPDDGISIGPDDPRIAWLWEDAERLAVRKGYCSQYDFLTGALGIPGRVRTFKVEVTIAPKVTTTISTKARTKAEAEANVRALVADSTPLVGAAKDPA